MSDLTRRETNTKRPSRRYSQPIRTQRPGNLRESRNNRVDEGIHEAQRIHFGRAPNTDEVSTAKSEKTDEERLPDVGENHVTD